MRAVPETSNRPDWPRLVANTVNALVLAVRALRAPETIAYTPSAEPTSPTEGMTYYDSASHKLRVYDGTLWQDAW